MGRAVTIGLDIAKSVFQLHGVGEDGSLVLRKRLRRTELLAFFRKTAFVPHRNRGLRFGAPLGTRTYATGAYRPADGAYLRETLPQTWKERRRRRGRLSVKRWFGRPCAL
jgi:hypothetical protein